MPLLFVHFKNIFVHLIFVVSHQQRISNFSQTMVATYRIYLYRNPGVYFLKMIVDKAFIWALSVFYIGVCLLRVLNPCVYLGPGVYISPTFIRINTVHTYKYSYICTYVSIHTYTHTCTNICTHIFLTHTNTKLCFITFS